jgi:uncharacterized membrane protein HdeD (DUF308 family)
MNKSIYHFGIFFLGLISAYILFQGILQLRVGGHLFIQHSFIAWFLTGHAIALTTTVFLLNYFHSRAYWAAFYTGIVTTIVNICFGAVFFIMLTTRASNSYYMPMFLIVLTVGIVYTLTLTFSNTRKKFWLRIAGAYGLIISLILASLTVWGLLSKDIQLNSTLGKIYLWASIAGDLIHIPLIIHFLSEAKLLNTENTSPVKESLKITLGIARSLALISVLIFGFMLLSESISSMH